MDITITGASDDLIEFEGVPDYDEFCNASNSAVKFRGNLIAPDKTGVRVIVIYDNEGRQSTGCWYIAVGLLNEDVAYPEWPVTFSEGNRCYTITAIIEAPDGTILVPDEQYI